jgi:hypothetical protein
VKEGVRTRLGQAEYLIVPLDPGYTQTVIARLR